MMGIGYDDPHAPSLRRTLWLPSTTETKPGTVHRTMPRPERRFLLCSRGVWRQPHGYKGMGSTTGA